MCVWRGEFLRGEEHGVRGFWWNRPGGILAGGRPGEAVTQLGGAGVSTVVKYERQSDIWVGILAGLT